MTELRSEPNFDNRPIKLFVVPVISLTTFFVTKESRLGGAGGAGRNTINQDEKLGSEWRLLCQNF